MLNELQYRFLRRLNRGSSDGDSLADDGDYKGVVKLKVHLGTDGLARFRGKTVIDFGCGIGTEAVAIAGLGAKRVIGIDIRESILDEARRCAALANVQHICHFTTSTTERADIVLSMDAFEHFDDPAEILRLMHGLLAPQGEAVVSFGYPWYHPWAVIYFRSFPGPTCYSVKQL